MKFSAFYYWNPFGVKIAHVSFYPIIPLRVPVRLNIRTNWVSLKRDVYWYESKKKKLRGYAETTITATTAAAE